ncbi:MAG: thiamine phosphate synthase [Terracidiphilus sp.]|jgi:thiamine-phosphate pyrophosphorylase
MMTRQMQFPKGWPRIYPILDSSFIPATGRAEFLHKLGSDLAEAGVALLEYRNKAGGEAELLADAEILRRSMPAGQVKLILDDRADLVENIGFDGVHVDAGDVSPAEARKLLGPDRIIGTFGGGAALVPGILQTPADYFSIGVVYPTRTKKVTAPPIGIEGVRHLREQAGPGPVLVAIGGITPPRAAAVLAAGATVLAVAGGLFRQPDPAAEFRKWMAELK